MNVHVTPQLASDATATFAHDAVEGLTHSPKRLSPKYFYDSVGSNLFEQITRLPEYYPTRTELGILDDRADEIATLIPANAALVEFGAGSTTKVRKLLEHSPIAAYVPVDISGEFLEQQAADLRKDFPGLKVYPVTADFTLPFELPGDVAGMPKVGFFPGSTLGNFEPQDAAHFLARAAGTLGKGAIMILGVDLEKDEPTLRKAYNDGAGVTAQFNLNVLTRMNRELGADFDLAAFDHKAIYNRDQHRIEMHLFSRKPQDVTICGQTIRFARNESIHT
ncbi:MAG: L-histidine N(alpha)-methyltransferase, partial [Oxalobacteraceae bacterium]